MVVCHCEQINDRTISEIASNAVTTIDDVTARCGAGGRCGGCHESIERVLQNAGTRVTIAA